MYVNCHHGNGNGSYTFQHDFDFMNYNISQENHSPC